VRGRPYKVPFELPSRERTRKTYRSWWKRLLWFSLRLQRLQDKVDNEGLPFQLSEKQRHALERQWSALRQHELDEHARIGVIDEENDEGISRNVRDYARDMNASLCSSPRYDPHSDADTSDEEASDLELEHGQVEEDLDGLAQEPNAGVRHNGPATQGKTRDLNIWNSTDVYFRNDPKPTHLRGSFR